MRKKTVFLSVVVALIVLVAGLLAFRQISLRVAANRFSDSMLLFSTGNRTVFSYSFPRIERFIGDDECMYYLDPQAQVMDSIPPPPEGEYELSCCSPDGEHIAFLARNSNEFTTVPIPQNHVPELRAYTMARNRIYVLERRTQELFKVHDDCDFSPPSWSPDSRALIFGSGGHIYRFHLESRKTELLREGTLPSLSPDGNRLAYFAHGKLCWGNLSLEAPEHEYAYRTLLQSRLDPSFIYSPEPFVLWSPDGEYLLMAHYGESGFSLDIPFPFIHFGGWAKIFIIDADTENVVYEDKEESFHNRVVWVPRS